MQNLTALYRVLFKTAADTIKELAADPNYLGFVPRFHQYPPYMGTESIIPSSYPYGHYRRGDDP